MRRLLQIFACCLSFSATSVAAQQGPVVIELYTSQGCSSCPPADEMLAELATRDDIIAMALHVDYWDYIGWADIFARPEHTNRQQDYARAAGNTTIYTPQFVVGGQDLVIGARGMELADTIQAHRQATLPVAVSLERQASDSLTVAVEMAQADPEGGPYVIQLAQMSAKETVEINRGENAGRQISYSNIVQRLDVLERWDGRAPMTLQVQTADVDLLAVIVQRGTNGAVVGAAKLQ